jgi:hypothetical protein
VVGGDHQVGDRPVLRNEVRLGEAGVGDRSEKLTVTDEFVVAVVQRPVDDVQRRQPSGSACRWSPCPSGPLAEVAHRVGEGAGGDRDGTGALEALIGGEGRRRRLVVVGDLQVLSTEPCARRGQIVRSR